MPRNVAHVGYVNPALSHASIPSRPVSYAGSRPVSRVGSRMGSRAGSLVDLNLDHLSHWDDDVSDDLPWDGQVPHIDDSGLHSLVVSDICTHKRVRNSILTCCEHYALKN